MEKHADIIQDRIEGVKNDLKTFIDLRVNDRQHGKNKFKDNLGGGNMVMAISLFASLNLLSKCYVCVTSTERSEFDVLFDEHGFAKEDKAFVEFMEFVTGTTVGLFAEKPSKTSLRSVWEYFRDFSTHVLVPDQGHSVMTRSWPGGVDQSVEAALESIRQSEHVVFEKREDKTWVVRVDKLLALLPEMTGQTTNFLREHGKTCQGACNDNLQKVLWRHNED